jgi:hypothetical protein
MKTTHNRTKHSSRHTSGMISCLGLLLAAGTLVSCGTASPGKPDSVPVSLQSSHWFKAKSNPPTYFPKGVPVDHPTTVSDGSWVMTGDAVGTRYFIPARGVDNRALTAEAMTAMTSERREHLMKGGTPDVNLNLAEGIGSAARGLGGLLVELDHAASHARNRQDFGPSRGAVGLFERTERR